MATMMAICMPLHCEALTAALKFPALANGAPTPHRLLSACEDAVNGSTPNATFLLNPRWPLDLDLVNRTERDFRLYA